MDYRPYDNTISYFLGQRGPLLFKLTLVISIKTPPCPVIVINTIFSLVQFNTPYKAYFLTLHAGLFPTFHGFSYSFLWIIYLFIIMIKCPRLYIRILVIHVLHVLLTTYLHISISPFPRHILISTRQFQFSTFLSLILILPWFSNPSLHHHELSQTITNYHALFSAVSCTSFLYWHKNSLLLGRKSLYNIHFNNSFSILSIFTDSYSII